MCLRPYLKILATLQRNPIHLVVIHTLLAKKKNAGLVDALAQ